MAGAETRVFLAILVILAGCGGAAGEAPVDAQLPDRTTTDAGADTLPPPCGTGSGTLPSGLTELSWDDGGEGTSLRDEDWGITLNEVRYPLNEQVLWEAVRFDLPRPARIYGFAVKWAGLPDGAAPELELAAGLYPDFGHNGFDFWQADPYWEGTRCARDIVPGEWVTYVLDEPR